MGLFNEELYYFSEMNKIASLILFYAFLSTIGFSQSSSGWITPLADARFHDTTLVIVVSTDYEFTLNRIIPPVIPSFVSISKNRLHGAPSDINEYMSLLSDELLNERLLIGTKELKENFLRRMAVLVFIEFADIENIDLQLIQAISLLQNDPDNAISEKAIMVNSLYEFYLEKLGLLKSWKRPTKTLSEILPENILPKDDVWPKEYWTYKRCIGWGLTETYDHGYLLNIQLRTDPQGAIPRWTWIIKTDINGEILWEKKFGDGIHATTFFEIFQCDDGGYLIPGAVTWDSNPDTDALLMKLNSCGEKEWCRIFLDNAQDNLDDGILNVFPLENEEGFIALVIQWGDFSLPGQYKGIWLFRLANDGSLVWIKNVFDQVNINAWNEIPKSMLLSKFKTEEGKEKFIITAFTYYFDYGGPLGWPKKMVCAADEDGNELWWAIHHEDENYTSEPGMISKESSGGFIYTVGRDEQYDDTLPNYYPSLFKTDKDGNKIFSKYIIDSTYKAGAFCLNILNDTLIDIGGVWKYEDNIPYASIARTDTNGNFIAEKKVIQSEYGFGYSIKTIDNKELFLKDEDWGTNTSVFLYKFNYELESDTLYTQPFQYDYLCDDLPIASDTIGIDDCDLWTKLPGEIEYRNAKQLFIFPCPAENEITITLPEATADEHPWGPMTSRQYNYRYHENSILKIFDVYGRLIEEISLKNIEGNELKLKVTGVNTGIYLVNLFENQKLMASGKFVKK
jgi:hypothetical protein